MANVSASSDSFSVDDAGNMLIRVFGGLSLGLINSADLWILAAIASMILVFFVVCVVSIVFYSLRTIKRGG